MDIALYIISILFIAVGTSLVIFTEGTRGFLKKPMLSNSVRLMAIIPLIVGILLAIGAFYHRQMFELAFTLGILAIIKGLYLALGPLNQIKRLMEWWFTKADNRTIRFFGLISFLLGTVIFSYLF